MTGGSEMLRRGVKICFIVVDLCAAIPVALWACFACLVVRLLVPVSREFAGETNVLFLSGGSTLEDCYKKFGSFEPLFNYDGPVKTFDRVFLFWYPVTNNLTVTFRDDYVINERRGIRLLPLTSHLLLLVEFLIVVKRKGIKAIRAFDPYRYGLMGWAVSRLSGIPCCVSVHADYEKREALQGSVIPRILGSRRLAERVERFVYRRVDLVLPIRESLAEKIGTKAGGTGNVRLFPHGVDLAAFDVAHDLDWLEGPVRTAGKKIVSVVGRLEKETYLDDVISIAEALGKKRRDFVLLIAGDGTQRTALEAQIAAKGLSEQVVLLGFVARDRVVGLRMNSHLSLCLMAGFSLIEACAAGRPVISYDVEWHHELVHNDRTGFLVPEGDIDGVVSKIEYLLDNAEAADAMGEEAKSLAFERHSLDVTARVKDEVYAELLARHSEPV